MVICKILINLNYESVISPYVSYDNTRVMATVLDDI